MNTPYVSKELLPGVWEITDKIEGIKNYADMYLVEGTKNALLIDAGESNDNLSGFIRQLTDKPVDLLITHGHPDHAAAIAQFDKVYMSHKDIKILTGMFGFILEESSIINLTGSEIFDLGGCKLEVIALPGHTYGSMVILDRERQLLFTSDGLGSSRIWMQLPHSEPLEVYLEAIRKLEEEVRDLNSLRILVGHDCQRSEELTKQYITDIRILTEKIISGEITGTPTKDQSELFGGLSASYGMMKAFIYKTGNIVKQ